MNSQIADEIFMGPVAARSVAQVVPLGQGAFKLAVASAILTAVTAGLFTATTAIGVTSSVDVQYAVRLLNTAGYAARVTGTNLVVNW